ncbi:GMC oxidoreductase-domain-containing protein [Ustulina deusta]|nr:GMC oxidoreductase-domain-containing protein [Ustulina deusta]
MSTVSFDFIIAGGGTAGIALATRLSEIAHQSVLILEAGLDHSGDPRVKIPAFYSTLFGTDADWGFRSVAQDWATIAPYYTKAFASPHTPEEHRQLLGVDSWGPDNLSTSGPVQLSYPGDSHHPMLQYSHGGQIKVANAQKEIIVSTGALQSPKLLELSGVGNTNILRQHNIEVVKDHPGVGENLQDHLVCDISFAAEDKMETLDALARQEPKAVEEAMLNFMQKHEGILTSAGIMTYAYLPVIDFLTDAGRETLVKMIDENRPSGSSTPEDPRAQMYYQVAEKTLLDRNRPSAAYLTAIGQNPVAPDPTTGKSASPQPGKHLIIATVLAQPLSRGTVHITSNNPAEVPKIDPKYLSNPLDVEIFAKHILYIESIANSAPLSGVLRQSLQPSSPLAHITDLNAAKRYMQSRTISMWHPAGTCAMLPEQIGGVVDNHLRVYGVGNLRVVDSSIVPLLPRC